MKNNDLTKEQLLKQISALQEKINGLEKTVAAQRQTEDALSASEQNLSAILESNADGIVIVDTDGTVLYVNPAAEKLFGKRKEEFLGYPFGFPVSADKAVDSLVIRKGDTLCEAELRVVQVQWQKRPAFQLSVRDITERRRLEEQIRHAQKLEGIGQLAGGIAHDFNNVLTAVVGYSELLQMQMVKSDPLKHYVDEIAAAGQRGVSLTRQILAFSRKQVLDMQPVNLNEIIKNLEKMLRRLLREDISIEINLFDKDLVVLADASQIDQVLINFVTNARDALPMGGRLSIATGPFVMDEEYVAMHGYGSPGEYALLTVSDTGSGMDAETRAKMFEPFFTTKEVGMGTGLGLAVVHGIVKQHGGYIDVYSEVEKGTIFKIYLPMTKHVTEKAEIKSAVEIRGGTETILIAEDDAVPEKTFFSRVEALWLYGA